MGKIKWVLINIDNTQIDYKESEIIKNSEMRRTINHLLDNGVHFTTISGLYSENIAKYVKELYIPSKKSFIISSYGCEIYSLKKKKVIHKYPIDNKYLKDLSRVIKRIDFDFCQKIFVELHNKKGDVFVWYNKNKYFNKLLEDFSSKNRNNKYQMIDDIIDCKNLLNASITFLESVDLSKLILFLENLNEFFSYKIVEKNKIIITSIYANVGKSMELINSKYYKLNKDAIMCFSDSMNDVDIFKKSGTSITIDGANDELKKSATNVFVGVENMYINEFLKTEFIKSN